MDKKVRMADIAQQLGISVVSVSKALSGKEGVSDATREKVLELARKMDYVPLRSKESTTPQPRSHSGNIGILMADLFFEDNTFYSNMYRQLVKCCNENGYSVMLELVTAEAEENLTIPAMVQGQKVDGLIFMGEFNKAYIRSVSQVQLPFILLDSYHEDLDADSITSDNVAGGYRLAKHLLQSGRTRIGFVGSILSTSSIMDRFLGYSKALLQAGIEVRMDWVLEDRVGKTTPIAPRLPEDMPEAFICSCDDTAYTLVELLKRSGYRIPQDVAVAGYDDYHIAQFCTPQLTTYRVNAQDMARHAAAQLIRRIKKKPITPGNMVVCGEVILREST